MSSGVSNPVLKTVQPFYDKFIRPHTPKMAFSITNVDGAFRYGRLFDLTREIEYKPSAVRTIEEAVRDGDHVIEVATGPGVFSLLCRRQGATVEGFEGAIEKVGEAEHLHESLNPPGSLIVNHALVEAPRDLYGDGTDAEVLDASDLPDGDVLLLDCEGSELDILRRLTSEYDRILVETHPSHGASTDAVKSEVRRLGYEIQKELPMGGGKAFLLCAMGRPADQQSVKGAP